VYHALPAPECRDQLVRAATEIARVLPIAGGWQIGYEDQCEDLMHVQFTNVTPAGTVVMELRVFLPSPSPTRCTERHCRETDIGPLIWDMLPSSLYGDPPGQIATHDATASLVRKRDRRGFQLDEWTTYPKNHPALAHPYTPEQLSDAVLAAGHVM
jgi:hypothetical protein